MVGVELYLLSIAGIVMAISINYRSRICISTKCRSSIGIRINSKISIKRIV